LWGMGTALISVVAFFNTMRVIGLVRKSLHRFKR
jgi:hypothetical protein